MSDNNNLMGPTAAVAVTAAILSPAVRGVLRKGAVQGLAGVLIASDAVSAFARGVGRGLQSGDASPQPDASAMGNAQEGVRAGQEAATAAPAAAKATRTAKPKGSRRTRKSSAAPHGPTVGAEGESR